mmetsp:Transcript_8436/g.12702  ORF Transcript_8436/g.12702 Transcript_8436/m.12702 type:complete len:192 (-) Transcript_8436:259-834(-)
MAIIDDMQGKFGTTMDRLDDRCSTTDNNYGYDGPRSFTNEKIIHKEARTQPDHIGTATGARQRSRRLRFVDEVPASSLKPADPESRPPPRKVVTSITYRPYTTAEEKSMLYYTTQEFTYFALEDCYSQREMRNKSCHGHPSCNSLKKGLLSLSWEDCMVHYYEDEYKDEYVEEETTRGTLHKVETCRKLQL